MATRKNTFLLKRSNVAGNVPTAGQLQLGELALNTADVILYASGTTANSILPIGWNRVARTGDTMTGTLYAPTVLGATFSASSDMSGFSIVSTQSIGDEGGEFRLNRAATNTSLSGGVTIDVYQNKLRIFETGGTNRGGYWDVTALAAGVGTNFLSGGGGGGVSAFTYNNANTFTINGGYSATINTVTGFTVNGNLSAATIDQVDYIDFNTGATTTSDVGRIAWNATDGTYNMGLTNGVTLQAGQEQNIYGKASSAITNGDVVMFNGAQGEHMLFAKADPAIINNAEYKIIGIATQNFAANDFGYVTTFGKVRDLNTIAYSAGTVLYFNSTGTTTGAFTNVEPPAPYSNDVVGSVIRSHATQGIILVNLSFRFPLRSLEDVEIQNVQNNDIIQYSGSAGYYVNTNNPKFTSLSALTMTAGTFTGNLTGTASLATSATTALSATNAANIYITDDATSNIDYYVTFVKNTNQQTNVFTDAGRLTYNPSTDTLKTTNGIFTSLIQTSNIQATGTVTATTISATTIFARTGLSATTISATTYLNLPTDVRVTGGTYATGTATFTNNTGGTFNVTGFNTGTVTSVAALTLGTAGTDLSSTVANGTTTPVITLNVPDASATARGVVTTGVQTFGGVKTFNSQINGTVGSFSQSAAGTTLNGYNSGTGGIGTQGGAGDGLGGYFVNNSTTYPVLKLLGLSNTRLLEGRGTSDNITSAIFSNGNISGTSFIRTGGTSAQFLKADGSVDSTTYVPSTRTITINGLSQDLSANRTWTISTAFSGGTVTGATMFTAGLSATTISATTYLNLPTDIRVTGGTYSTGTATFTNNTGGTFNVTGFNTGTVTSVAALTLGTSGTDLSSTVANSGTTPVITLNVPNASTTARGVVTTGTQTFGGAKTFTDNIQVTSTVSPSMGFDTTGTTTGTMSVGSSYFQFTAQASQGYLFKNYLGNNLLFLTTNGGAQFINSVTAGSFIKTGGTSTQFLKADGSVDSTTYVPTSRTLTINGTTYDLSADRSWTITSGGFSGGTVTGPTMFTGGLSANTFSATTYLNLPTDIRVTGGTYSTGTATFTNNTGGTFNVTGFNTGTVTSVAALTLGTSGTDLSSTVANGTTTPVITLNVPDASATARGVITTGAQTIAGTKTFNSTISGSINGNAATATSATTALNATSATTALNATNTTNVGITNNTATNAVYYPTFVSATSGNLPLQVDSNTFTFNPSTNLLSVGTISSTTVTADNFTGLASLATSATTALNATNAANILVTNLPTTDIIAYPTFVTGYGSNRALYADATTLTYNPFTDTLTLPNITATGTITATTVTATTVSATTVSATTVRGVTISATTYQNLPTDIRVTGGTYSSGTATFTNNTGGTFTVTGFSTGGGGTFTGGTVTGPTVFTAGLTANTISATTITAGTLTASSIAGIGGLQNYVAKFTSNGSFLGNSQIFDNGTNVGINTTSPSTKLEINGTNQLLTLRTTYAPDLSQKGAILWKDASNITGAIDTRYDGATVDMYFGSLYNSGYNTNTRMVIKGNGFVGINTTAPSKWLQVNGDALINGLTVGLGNGGTSSNTVLGDGAFSSNAGGTANVAIGFGSLTNNLTGGNNIGIGVNCLKANDYGARNIGIGNDSLHDTSNGTDNLGIGISTLYKNIGQTSIAIGNYALQNNVAGGTNIAIGYNAMNAGGSGDMNLVIGYSAADSLDGSNNLILGNNAQKTPENVNFSTEQRTLSIAKDMAGYTGRPHFWSPDTVKVFPGTGYILLADPNIYSAVFIDYSLEDQSGNLRAGTMKGIFDVALGTIKWDENATADIGSTAVYTFDFINNGSGLLGVELTNSGGVAVFCNYTSRLITRTIV